MKYLFLVTPYLNVSDLMNLSLVSKECSDILVNKNIYWKEHLEVSGYDNVDEYTSNLCRFCFYGVTCKSTDRWKFICKSCQENEGEISIFEINRKYSKPYYKHKLSYVHILRNSTHDNSYHSYNYSSIRFLSRDVEMFFE